MTYLFFFRPFILFVGLICFSHLIAIAQLSVDSNQQHGECEECLTKKDYLLALVQWRAELVKKHSESLQGNELFPTTVEYLKGDIVDSVGRDSVINLLNMYLNGSSIKYERAIFENIVLRDVDYYINRAEAKHPSSISIHKSLRLRGLLHAFQDVGSLAMVGLLEPEWPLKLNLKKHPTHVELGAYHLKRDEIVGDVGTGMGIIPRILGRVGIHTYANEIGVIGLGLPIGYPNYLKRLKESLPDSLAQRLEVVKGSKKSTNFPEGVCDVILIRNSFHHFTHPEDMISSVKESLRTGGRVLVVDHYLDTMSVIGNIIDGESRCEDSQPFQFHLDQFAAQGFNMIRREDVPTGLILTEWVLEE